MGVNEPQFLQDQKCAEILFSDQGENENPLMGEQLNNINAGFVQPSKPQKQLAQRSQ